MVDKDKPDTSKNNDAKDKHVKIQVEGGEDEAVEGETFKKRAQRFQMPNVPRWWQAKIIHYAFAHPHVRARLEKHMGSNLVQLTDKQYMNDLEDRIIVVNEENLEKRISARVLDEMERLKRLILVGKTPLKECPPELYKHPVFVFWRMVNKEVAKASKKRADAYYKKLKGTQKLDQQFDEESEELGVEEENVHLTPAQLLEDCKEELEQRRLDDISNGFRFPEEEFALLKYESMDIKNLKKLTTVEEMYTLADKIIGTKRV